MARSIAAELRQMGWSDEQIAGATCKGQPLAALESQPKPVHGMNKTEAAYAHQLDRLVESKVILGYWWEPFRLRLTDPDPTTRRADYYVPDFLVWYGWGNLEIVEIKGFLRDDAARKFKAAQTRYPCFRFRMLRKTKDGWETIMGG